MKKLLFLPALFVLLAAFDVVSHASSPRPQDNPATLPPQPMQPLEFNHAVHVKAGLQCASCHQGAASKENAGYPATSSCMTCHQVIAKDDPEVKKLAAFAAEKKEVPWGLVYGYEQTAYVIFEHGPHVSKARIDCATCHGDMSKTTVTTRSVYMSMEWCEKCHDEQGVSNDCAFCHYGPLAIDQ